MSLSRDSETESLVLVTLVDDVVGLELQGLSGVHRQVFTTTGHLVYTTPHHTVHTESSIDNVTIVFLLTVTDSQLKE